MAATLTRFVDFITARPLEGLGKDLATVKRLCRDDVEAVDLIDRVSVVPNHRPVSSDNVTTFGEPAERGNRADAAIRRLRKDRPDLHARVIAGELSPHTAAVSGLGLHPAQQAAVAGVPRGAAQ